MAKDHLTFIKEKWKALELEPNVFQYNLNVLNHKILDGQFNFHCELNPDRSKLRRIPQIIPSLSAEFDPNKFNFTKVKSKEKILDIPFQDTLVTFIINQSPLTSYHSLICPDLLKSQPQRITEQAIRFCVEFLLAIDDLSFRIGYNSPGALASVNHLHLHLMYIDYDMYVDNASLQPIGKTCVYRLHSTMPTEAICFIIDESNKLSTVQSIFELLEYICEQNVPHNIFITPDRVSTQKRLKLFIYAREKHSIIKELTTFNIAFCELSGFIPVGDTALYDKLTEEIVVNKIKEESGNIYSKIYKYINDL